MTARPTPAVEYQTIRECAAARGRCGKYRVGITLTVAALILTALLAFRSSVAESVAGVAGIARANAEQAAANKELSARNEERIAALNVSLSRIEAKLDRALGLGPGPK